MNIKDLTTVQDDQEAFSLCDFIYIEQMCRSLYYPALLHFTVLCCLVPKSCLTLQPRGLQNARLTCPSLSPGICSDSCPLNQGCHTTISYSVTHFSPCSHYFPESGSFPMIQLFASDGQRTVPSTLASVLPINIQG